MTSLLGWIGAIAADARPPTTFALETELLERDYYTHWQGLKKRFGG